MFAGCQKVASVECHIPEFRRFNKSRLPSERKTIANRKMLPKDAFLRLCLLGTCRVVPYTEINITDRLMVPTPYDESIFWNLFLHPTRSNDRGYYRLSPLTPATENFRLDRKYNETFPRLAQSMYQFPFHRQAFTTPHLRSPPTQSSQFTYVHVFALAFRKHFR